LRRVRLASFLRRALFDDGAKLWRTTLERSRRGEAFRRIIRCLHPVANPIATFPATAAHTPADGSRRGRTRLQSILRLAGAVHPAFLRSLASLAALPSPLASPSCFSASLADELAHSCTTVRHNVSHLATAFDSAHLTLRRSSYLTRASPESAGAEMPPLRGG
jgi:hypothetical protein